MQFSFLIRKMRKLAIVNNLYFLTCKKKKNLYTYSDWPWTLSELLHLILEILERKCVYIIYKYMTCKQTLRALQNMTPHCVNCEIESLTRIPTGVITHDQLLFQNDASQHPNSPVWKRKQKMSYPVCHTKGIERGGSDERITMSQTVSQQLNQSSVALQLQCGCFTLNCTLLYQYQCRFKASWGEPERAVECNMGG